MSQRAEGRLFRGVRGGVVELPSGAPENLKRCPGGEVVKAFRMY